MKILIYIDSMAPAGGIERVVSKHIAFFAKKHQIILITKDKKDSFYDLSKNIEIYSLNIDSSMNMYSKVKRIFQTLKQLIVTRKKLKVYKNKYDLFYVTHIRNLFELYLAGVDMKKVIVTEHGSYYGYNNVYKKLKLWLYPKCKYIVSPTSMDYEIYKFQNCNAFYIPNPLSFFDDKFSNLEQKTVINIGRLTSDKRQDLLLYIWRNISANHLDWKLKLVGKGELKEQLIELVKEYNLQNSVEIIDPIKNVEDLFLNSSIFAFTSKYEGFGMVLAEAMAYGVPCISFDIPSGPRDIIENNIDGFLIEDNNIQDYICKLDLMIINYEKRKEMGKNAKQNIQKFLDTKIEEKWNQLLENGEI